MSNLEKAIEYFKLLGPIGDVYTYDSRLRSSSFCCLEKQLCVALVRILDEIYGIKEDFSKFLYLKIHDGFDFFSVTESEDSVGYMESGEYMTRGDFFYNEYECPTSNFIERIYTRCQWKIDYLDADLSSAYYNFKIKEDGSLYTIPDDEWSEDKENDAETLIRIFSLRTNTEVVSDFLLDDFFDKEDLCSENVSTFINYIRDLASTDKTSQSHYFLTKSWLLPRFLALDKSIIQSDDRWYIELIDQCLDAIMQKGHGHDSWGCYSGNLKWSYFMFDMSSISDGFSIVERDLGVIAMEPHMMLVPYIIDESIKYLNEKYHFISEEDMVYAESK